ncbi:MAG: hypothetical protein MZW92_28535 [Comamonadaceae bacterium]|nr:hypothetical protein [Comamonadaceae bacterium]
MALAITGAGGLCAARPACCCIGRIVGSFELDVVLAAGDADPRRTRCTCRRWCWCCWAPSPRARSSRSTSGCRTRWRRRRRCRPTCTRRRWSRPACSCWRGCTRRWAAASPGSGSSSPVGLATLLVGAYIGDLPARPEGAAGLFDDQPPRPDHAAVRPRRRRWPWWPACSTSSTTPPSRPSLFMAAGIIDHEMRHARHAAASTACGSTCRVTATLAHRGGGGDGRRAAAQRLPVEGDVLRRDGGQGQRTGADARGCCRPAPRWPASSASPTALRFIHDVFFNGEPRDLPKTPHEPPRFMRAAGRAAGACCAWRSACRRR